MTDELGKLERRMSVIEGSVNPLLSKLDIVADKITLNTIQQTKTEASHDEVVKMLARVQKRQDKQDTELIELYKDFAEYRPTLKQWSGMGVKMMYFGFAMLFTSVAAFILIAKMFIGTAPIS